jgi:succinate-semialdehyde dehydrogenase/glutarate-semialdehyde dehydrogenase
MDAKVKVNLDDPALLRQQCYINGEWVSAASRQTIDVTDPATGAVIASVPSLSAAEVRGSIEAADVAWGAWRKKTGKERSQIMRTWFNL